MLPENRNPELFLGFKHVGGPKDAAKNSRGHYLSPEKVLPLAGFPPDLAQ